MANFSSKEIGSQYNLIKMLFSNKTKYAEAIETFKKNISYMPIELKKKFEKESIVL